MEIDLKKRQQTMMVLWFALLLSIGSYFVFAQRIEFKIRPEPGMAHNPAPIVALTVLGFLLVTVSFAVKRRFLQKSVERQNVGLVQQGMIVAWALCELCALLGLLDRFLIGNREYYLLFVLAAAGIVFHIPRREQLLAASPKIPITGASS